MYRRLSMLRVFVIAACFFCPSLAAAATLQWDHPAPTTVNGYIVTVDGARTDYGLQVAGSGGACGCTLSVNLSPGSHTVVVSAYNAAGETAAAPLTIDVAATPTTPPPSSLPAPWLTQDIGNVGATGSASVSNSTYTVRGSGADIWGTADSFRYLYQPLSGNGTIVARVTAMQNTHAFAKAGVMIRETTNAGSSHALLNLRPNGTIEFLSRNGAGAQTGVAGTTTQPAPVWLRLSRNGDTIAAAISANGSSWNNVGTTTVAMGANINVGLAVASLAPGTLNTATFDSLTITAGSTTTPSDPPPGGGGTPGGAVPSPWTNQDVGSTGLSGNASFGNGTFTLNGAGADVWGTRDAFHYVSQPIAGDGALVARVVSLQNTATFAKAGLMLRGGLGASAQDVVLNVRPNGSIEFMSRSAAGGETAFIASAGQTPPAWLRLTKAGNAVTAAVSRDGSSWSTIGSANVSGLAYGGLFVSSHDVSTRNTAVFDNVSAPTASSGGGGGGGGTASASEVVIYASDIPGSSLHGGWSSQASASAAANVKLVSADIGATSINNPVGSPSDYVDVSFDAVAGTPYALWLRLRATNNSKYNDSVWVQFSNARVNGSQVFAIGSTSGLLVNLATDSSASSLSDWGWQNGAYWFAQPTAVTFATSGRQTLRIQIREDGVQLDQIVLSPSRYLSRSPGSVSGDGTIVPR